MAKIKRMTRELVKLRSRKGRTGSESLYLDYEIGGERVRESLHLFLIPERTPEDRLQNTETMKVAQTIKAKRTAEIVAGETGIDVRKEKRKDTPDKGRAATLLQFLRSLSAEYLGDGQERTSTVLNALCNHVGGCGDVMLRSLDTEYLEKFLRHMSKSGLSASSQEMYWHTLKTSLRRARKERLTDADPSDVDRRLVPSAPPSTREHLTMDEIRSLASAPFPCTRFPHIRNAFFFSCFTGLRISDVQSLTWRKIVPAGEGRWQIEATQIKTGKNVYVPLSSNAESWLPERGEPDSPVFTLPDPESNSVNRVLAKWTAKAGIGKKVTFHVARHSFATLLLEYGTDIYTVSSMLGHSSVATTQIYAKVVDHKKREATDSIPEL